MKGNSVTRMEDTSLINIAINDLRSMVEDSIKYQTSVSPIYDKIAKTVLDIFEKQEELNGWEAKDLLKLLETVSKLRLKPIEELTSLVQSLTALYERSQLQDKIDELQDITKKIIEERDSSKEDPRDDDDLDDDDVISLDSIKG